MKTWLRLKFLMRMTATCTEAMEMRNSYIGLKYCFKISRRYFELSWA